MILNFLECQVRIKFPYRSVEHYEMLHLAKPGKTSSGTSDQTFSIGRMDAKRLTIEFTALSYKKSKLVMRRKESFREDLSWYFFAFDISYPKHTQHT